MSIVGELEKCYKKDELEELPKTQKYSYRKAFFVSRKTRFNLSIKKSKGSVNVKRKFPL